jgi:hypothetical protein
MAPALLILLMVGLTASSAVAGTTSEDMGGKSIQPEVKAAGVADAATCPVATSIIPSLNPYPNTGNFFNGIAAVSANNIWAVGAGGDRALIQHWDGSAWSIASTSSYGILYAVSVISASDVWAVGGQSLTLHWNGAQWSEVPVPGGEACTLSSVSGAAANDVWAVGSCYSSISSTSSPFATHWDGTQWQEIRPSFGDAYYGGAAAYYGVTAIASNDVWIVGYYTSADFSHPLSLHWDGAQWASVYMPGNSYDAVYAVDATSSSDVWAAGQSAGGAIWHWNGTTWSIVHQVQESRFTSAAISARAANDVWVKLENEGQSVTVVHWDGTQWSTVPYNQSVNLNGITAVSANNVWAVGQNAGQTLATRWNGNSWTVAPSPNIVTSDHHLRSVAYMPGGPVVAVGNAYREPMIQKWNHGSWTVLPHYHFITPPSGTFNDIASQVSNSAWAVGYKPVFTYENFRGVVSRLSASGWEDLEIPHVGFYEFFNGVDVLPSGDVWVVGYHSPSNLPDTQETLILHWNGAEWSIVPSPSPSERSRLNKVAVVSANDVWAVGTQNDRTLIMHWDGQAWAVVPSPNVGPDRNLLRAIEVISSDDIWAVGSYGPPGTGQALILHWNGSQWSVVPGPAVGTDSFLFDLDALAPDNVWAVGNYLTGGVQRTLLEHWDGQTWSVVPSPNVGAEPNYLFGIVAVSHNELWAVGDYSLNGGLEHNTLTVRIDPEAFSDVPPDSTFYPYVRCLTNNGILGGYSDCTFRPNANVTRGQLSKIVANSAGFNEPVSGQTFEDVPSANTFYEHIERMAARGIIGGYPCGGTGEPCGMGNKPYFRPNANATRGQISKIVSQAKGYTDPVSGQTFEDVSPTNSFYVSIERLASRGIMGGYQCGTVPSEPCGTGNKPYFRLSNNATRGQVSKIVANTFFPGCQVSNIR